MKKADSPLKRNRDRRNAPRIHTEGAPTVEFEKAWPESETTALKTIGDTVKTAGAATLSAVALEDGVMHAAMR